MSFKDNRCHAHRVNKGEMPLKTEGTELSDFYFIPAETPEEIHAKLIQVVTERIPSGSIFIPSKTFRS